MQKQNGTMRTLVAVGLLLIVAAAAAMALAACRPVSQPQSAAAAESTRVAQAAVAANAAAGAAESAAAAAGTSQALVGQDAAGGWSRIQEAGRLVVGTAADFPPFEAYDASFQIAGYDPALLQALGRQLGVEVVLRDFAFEGLPDALALGQIDVAAASLTVTPARAAQVDFTQPYFATGEGLLGQPGSQPGSIRTVEDLAGLRIGIERGSVYEAWLQRNVVEAGIGSEQELIRYTTVDDAAAGLVEGRIDLLVTDLPAARQLAQQYGLPLAGEGLIVQQYALAVRKGSDELRGQLNAALAALAQNGTLGRIAQEQLGMQPEEVADPGQLPAEAEPGSAAAPAQEGCRSGLAWLEDLSLPDQGMQTPAVMAPGQPFVKGWRVLNTGTCTWESGYQLVYAHGSAPGASMGGQAIRIGTAVAPGESYAISATLAAPITPGAYLGAWQMQDAQGRGFGERLRVGIQVAGVPTPTPGPTQTPVAGVSFTADAERVLQGSPVHFAWNVTGAEQVYFYQAGQDWAGHAVAPQGEQSAIPGATTTYQLRVVRPGGQVEDRAVTVYVEPNPDLPQVAYFTLLPGSEIAAAECVTITWRVEGKVDQAAIFRDKEVLWEKAPVEGSLADCPQAPGTYEYAVGAQGPGGRNYAVATLKVAEAAEAAKAAAAALGPAIDLFAVLPASVTLGSCVELRWTVSSDATDIRILRDETVVLEGAPLAGSGVDCPSTVGLRRYRLAASDAAGQTSEYFVNVEVAAPAATPVPTAEAAEAPAAAAAPAAPAAPPAPGEETLEGHEYVLIAYRSAAGELAPPLTGTQITITFGLDGRLGGSAGCNRYTSSYQVDGTSLSIAPIATTRMFCAQPIGLMDQESQYLSALPAAAQYQLQDGQLTLNDGAGNPVAVFVMVQ